jgi:hypothetical protein
VQTLYELWYKPLYKTKAFCYGAKFEWTEFYQRVYGYVVVLQCYDNCKIYEITLIKTYF